MLVNPNARRLREVLRATGLYGRPSIQNEAEYLASVLTAEQLASVALLIDRVLAHSHGVTHLPDAQALDAIRQEVERR